MAIVKRRRNGGKGSYRYGVRVWRPLLGRHEWVGTFDKRSEARAAERQALSAPTSGRMTVEQWCAHWLDGYAERVKDSTGDATRQALTKFRRDFGPRPLDALANDTVEAQGWARANRWRVPAVVTCLNAAVKARQMAANPFAGESRRSRGRKDIIPPTAEEVEALAHAAERVHDDYGPTMAALLRFLAWSGMRPGEVAALEWSDIDFAGMRIHVRRRRYKGAEDLPKSNTARTIVLTPGARDALQGLERTDARVFHGKRGGALSAPMLSGYWAPVCAAADRGDWDLYYLRHFCGHYMYVTLGLPARVVAVQLGHNDGGRLVESTYGHGDVGALEEIDRAFSTVVPLRSVPSRPQSRPQAVENARQ